MSSDTVVTNPKVEGLKNILNVLSFFLDQLQEDLKTSQALLETGAKTQLMTSIEKHMEDPIGSLSEVSNNIDERVKSILNDFVIGFLKKRKDLISKVVFSKTTMSNIHYSIVLKTDNDESRTEIFRFFDKYDMFEFSNKYPIYFQIVPENIAAELSEDKVIDLN